MIGAVFRSSSKRCLVEARNGVVFGASAGPTTSLYVFFKRWKKNRKEICEKGVYGGSEPLNKQRSHRHALGFRLLHYCCDWRGV